MPRTLRTVKGMSHRGYGHHADDCPCKGCVFRLRGRVLLYHWYSSREAESLRDLAYWFRKALESWLPSHCSYRSTVHFCGSVVRIRDNASGEHSWLYRVFVALPCNVSWDRLWEKLLTVREFGAEYALSLKQASGSADRIGVNVWCRPGGQYHQRKDFAEYCSSALESIEMRLDGKTYLPEGCLFGDREAVVDRCRQIYSSM